MASSVLEFCFNEIYQSVLRKEARRILSLMPIFNEPPDKDEIDAATGVRGDYLDRAIEQLVALSLLNEQLERGAQGELVKTYTVLPLTLSFAQAKLSEDRGLEVGARKKLREIGMIRLSRVQTSVFRRHMASSKVT